MSLPHLFKRAPGRLNVPLFSLNTLIIYWLFHDLKHSGTEIKMQDPRVEMCEREIGWWSKSRAKLWPQWVSTIRHLCYQTHNQQRCGQLQVWHNELLFHQFKSGQMMNGVPTSEAVQPSRTAAASVCHILCREQQVLYITLQMLHVTS